MNRIIYLIPAVILVGFGILFVMGLNRDSSQMPTALAGQDMPEIPQAVLEGYDGQDISDIFAENEVVLVNYWASWCAPCRVEHPYLEKLRDEAGAVIIGINYKDRDENAKMFLDEMGSPFAAVRVDESGRTAIDWGVAGVPETFFVKDGKIVDRHTGPIVSDNYDEVLGKLEALRAQ